MNANTARLVLRRLGSHFVYLVSALQRVRRWPPSVERSVRLYGLVEELKSLLDSRIRIYITDEDAPLLLVYAEDDAAVPRVLEYIADYVERSLLSREFWVEKDTTHRRFPEDRYGYRLARSTALRRDVPPWRCALQ